MRTIIVGGLLILGISYQLTNGFDPNTGRYGGYFMNNQQKLEQLRGFSGINMHMGRVLGTTIAPLHGSSHKKSIEKSEDKLTINYYANDRRNKKGQAAAIRAKIDNGYMRSGPAGISTYTPTEISKWG